MSSTGIEARVYSGNDPNDLLGVLPLSRQRQWTDALSDLGAGNLQVSLAHPALVEDPYLLDYQNVVTFAFRGAERFGFVIERKRAAVVTADEDAGRWLTVSGRGVLALLESALVYPLSIGFPQQLEVHSWQSGAGEIMGDLVDEAQARGALAGVSRTFTGTHDSDGDPFDVWLDVAERAGTDMLTVARRHAELAVDVHMTPGLELRYLNRRGVDRTTDPGAVLLRPGRDLAELSFEGEGLIKNALLVEDARPDGQGVGNGDFRFTEEIGGFHIPEDPPETSVARFGRKEGYLQLGNVTDPTQAAESSARVILAREFPVESIQVEIAEGAGPQPYVDFDLGDTVLAPDSRGQLTEQRVMAITVREDDDGKVGQSVELTARAIDDDARIARWLKVATEGSLGGVTHVWSRRLT